MEKHFLIEAIKTKLTYNPKTGDIFWKSSGKLAGYIENNGYRRITVNYYRFLAHHIAYVLMTGSFPVQQLDHKNKNRQDNSWSNLREATAEENSWNRSTRGVYKFPETSNRKKKWLAEIVKKGTRYSNYFLTEEEALSWRALMENRLYGAFAKDSS